MTLDDMIELFDVEAQDFDEWTEAPSKRLDLSAFLILDRLLPDKGDIVTSAEHDRIWLNAEPADLAAVASKNDIVNLLRCGVFYDERTESLSMLV